MDSVKGLTMPSTTTDKILLKADEKWVKSELSGIRREMRSLWKNYDEFKGEVKSLRNNNDQFRSEVKDMVGSRESHECLHKDTMTMLRSNVNSWTSWWRKTMVIIIVALVGGAVAVGGWMYSYAGQSSKVDSVVESVDEISLKVEAIDTSQKRTEDNQKELKRSVDKILAANEAAEKARLEKIREMLEVTLKRDKRIRRN